MCLMNRILPFFVIGMLRGTALWVKSTETSEYRAGVFSTTNAIFATCLAHVLGVAERGEKILPIFDSVYQFLDKVGYLHPIRPWETNIPLGLKSSKESERSWNNGKGHEIPTAYAP